MVRMSALRVALRLGRRDAWRNRGRSSLVAVMVALPVLAGAGLSTLYRSDQYDPQDVVRMSIGTQAQAGIESRPGEGLQQSADGTRSNDFAGRSVEGFEKETPEPYLPSLAEFRRTVESVISDRDQVIPDLSQWVEGIRFEGRGFDSLLREVDYTAPGAAGLMEQLDGQAPGVPGEVVVSRTLAEDRGIAIGDELSRAGVSGTLTVVGIVAGAPIAGEPMIVGLPGSLIPEKEVTDPRSDNVQLSLLVTGPDPVTWDQVLDLNGLQALVTSRAVIADPPPDERVPYEQNNVEYSEITTTAAAITAIVIGLGLLQVALMAGPAIAVGARRNQRSLAILASTGAERKHLRAVVLATNGVIGVVASTVAVVVGAGVGAVAVLVLQRYFDASFPRVDINPLDLLGLVLVGGLTAVGAALIPARQTARMDVVAALTGRRGQLAPRLGVPLAGLVIFAIGAVLAFLSSGRHSLLLPVIGLALAQIGLIAASGAVLALVGRLAVHLPFVPRFALRDAARQRSRTTPAVAAVLAAVAGGAAALVSVSALAAHDRAEYSPGAGTGVAWVSTSTKDETQVRAAEATVRRIFPGAQVLVARTMTGADGWDVYAEPVLTKARQCPLPYPGEDGVAPTEAALRSFRADPRCVDPPAFRRIFNYPGSSLFDDGTVLEAFTGRKDPAAVAALRAGRTVVSDPKLLWPDGSIHLTVTETPPGGTTHEPRTRTVVLPATLSTLTPRLSVPVFPLAAAGKLGVRTQADGLVVDTPRTPTSREEDLLTGAYPEGNSYVERGFQNKYSYTLLGIVVAAGLVTLVGTFTAVGLAAVEGRADVATLAAVGAGPGVRRRLAASQAGVIAGLGSVLGVVSGVLAGWVLARVRDVDSSDSPWAAVDADGRVGWTLVLPWEWLLTIGVGLPLLVVAVAFLTTRSQLPLVRRLGQ